MADYVVRPGDAQQYATAVIRYQVSQPLFANGAVLAVLVFGTLGALTGGVGGAVLAAAICLVLELATIARKRGQLLKIMLRRGYGPGSTIGASFDDDTFTIATDLGSGVHDYAMVSDSRRIGSAVVLRLTQGRAVLALPGELVPAGTETRFGPARTAP